jgi:hypothetical protein
VNASANGGAKFLSDLSAGILVTSSSLLLTIVLKYGRIDTVRTIFVSARSGGEGRKKKNALEDAPFRNPISRRFIASNALICRPGSMNVDGIR